MKIDHKESFQDFGDQFSKDSKIDEYFGSLELLQNIIKPFNLNQIKNKSICEVGLGSGRITNNLLKFSPLKITGIEPSEAIKVAKKNISSDKVNYLNIKGEEISHDSEFDYVFSIGVIHHIPNYKLVLKNIYRSLKPGGKFIVWVYGKEGNELYLFIFNNLRRITINLPDFSLKILSNFLCVLTYIYGFLCKFIRLPMQKYFLNFFNKFSFEKKSYIIFDQLNPSFAKYFTKKEFEEELRESNFQIDHIEHRLNYSYTAICSKRI